MYLLAQDAVADSKRTDGATPLWIAAQMGHDHIVAQLLKVGAFVDAARHVFPTIFFITIRTNCCFIGWSDANF